MDTPPDFPLDSPEDAADRAQRHQRRHRELLDWLDGRDGPAPHLYKERVIAQAARRTGARSLVETGTYIGEMIDAQRASGLFDRIISIELSEMLADRARRRYASCPEVEIVQGDSGTMLAEVIPTLTGPAVFWLDGHYSMGFTARGDDDTPILAELGHVLKLTGNGHTILIDDARCFHEEETYPSIPEVESLIRASWPDASIVLCEDIVRVSEHP